jgi:hypothetical protein
LHADPIVCFIHSSLVRARHIALSGLPPPPHKFGDKFYIYDHLFFIIVVAIIVIVIIVVVVVTTELIRDFSIFTVSYNVKSNPSARYARADNGIRQFLDDFNRVWFRWGMHFLCIILVTNLSFLILSLYFLVSVMYLSVFLPMLLASTLKWI